MPIALFLSACLQCGEVGEELTVGSRVLDKSMAVELEEDSRNEKI